MYSELTSPGWGRKIAYCVAFSMDGATDVTRRYVRSPAKYGLGRTRCPEEVLLYITHEIRKLRRENMDKEQRRRLMREDEREEKELRGYVAQSLTEDMMNSLPTSANPQETKTREQLEQEQAAAWQNQQQSR